MNHIYTFWVDKPGSTIPPYIQLCMQTWFNNIPDLELTVINYDNLFEWVPETFDIRALKALSLPMQSDVVSFHVLAKHSGIYMDADTIITNNVFEKFRELESDKNNLYLFGYDAGGGGSLVRHNRVHVGVMAAFSKYNPFLSACIERQETMLLEILTTGKLRGIAWNSFANAIIDEVTLDPELNGLVRVIDRTKSGAVLESCFLDTGNTSRDYLDFYFKKNDIDFEDVLRKIDFGLVNLHNSWTPAEFSALDFEGVVNSELMLSKLLRYALGDSFFA